MNITGYKIRATLKSLEMQLEGATRAFTDSLVKYPSETKPHPEEAMDAIMELDAKIARLQAAQAQYNCAVAVSVLGTTMSLSEAVKQVGGAGRCVALWKKASGATSSNGRHHYEEPVYSGLERMARENDKEYAVRAITPAAATALAVKAERYASALRGAIAEGNATVAELDLDPSLFLGE